ncbi:unnamed protein product, partial [Hapterophycus canaliculatus]
RCLAPDVHEEEYVAHTCDQDAYAYSGQKCSAQSILFVHENWSKFGILNALKKLASQRKLEDLTVGPVLSVTTEVCMKHIESLLKIRFARAAW